MGYTRMGQHYYAYGTLYELIYPHARDKIEIFALRIRIKISFKQTNSVVNYEGIPYNWGDKSHDKLTHKFLSKLSSNMHNIVSDHCLIYT